MLGSLHRYILDKWLSLRVIVKGVCFFVVLVGSSESFAQNSEIGIELGAYNYMGDLARDYDFGNHSVGAQFFFRKHLNNAFSTRLSVGFGNLKGRDDQAFDVFSANRSASFKSNFRNLDFLLEYHFLDYRDEKLQQHWSPYLMFGLGAYYSNGEDNFGSTYDTGVKLRVPIGMGIKYRLDRKWIFGIFTQVIKTYSDELDNVSAFNPNIKNYQGGNPNNDDIMFFTGISLSYTFYNVVCPQNKWP